MEIQKYFGKNLVVSRKICNFAAEKSVYKAIFESFCAKVKQ
jgi:hypothetical protein